uniref:Putative ovule protein n=1 Tax=Solanum chacoense TaxID=4108 RepID=A0A0V0GI79_SOLCH
MTTQVHPKKNTPTQEKNLCNDLYNTSNPIHLPLFLPFSIIFLFPISLFFGAIFVSYLIHLLT